jgi:diacylglycerol kinase family enzyme
LHNPSAGDEDHSADEVSSVIERAGHRLEYRSADEPGWEQAIDGRGDVVAIAGGDGTVAKVLRALAGKSPRLATVLPLGSANNIARTLGIADESLGDLVAGWANARRRRYHLGEVAGPAESLTFVETVGGGLFAHSILRAQTIDAGDEDKVELGLRLLRRLVDELPPQSWKADLDGTDYSGEFLAVEAMVIGWTGPGVPLAPSAVPEDRLLDVVQISDRDRAGLAAYLDDRLEGRVARPPALTVRRCRKARLSQDASSPLRIDDELWQADAAPAGSHDVSISISEACVELLVPR